MFSYTEFDEIADQIASDIPARDSMGFDEARQIARTFMGAESRQVIDNVAQALVASYTGG